MGDRIIFIQNYPSEIINGVQGLKKEEKLNDSINGNSHLKRLYELKQKLSEVSNPVLFIAEIKDNIFQE